jgi:6-pyruvoyltetrahydropterin/6-carboxytetrahydropterin synthase
MFITRRVEFSASHICAQPQFSQAENRALYGAAANPNGHGHNYVLEVTLSGEPHPTTGMVFDLKNLKRILSEAVVDPMDHRFLNREVRPFDRVVPTAENIAVEIWNRLVPYFKDGSGDGSDNGSARLSNVRLYETEDLYVDYAGPSQ